MDLTTRQYRSLLRSACKKAETDGVRLDEVLSVAAESPMEAALLGGGLADITSTSNAGQSVSTNAGASGTISGADISSACELLLTITEGCLADDPSLTGPDLCACVMGKLPKRGVRRVGASYFSMRDV